MSFGRTAGRSQKPGVVGAFATGATLGGVLVGLAEGAHGGVPLYYPAALYAALWAVAGMGAALVGVVLIGKRRELFGAGPVTWGAATAIGASTLALGRFIVLRDVLHEAVGAGTTATAAAAGAAVVAAGLVLMVGRASSKRFQPMKWPWALPVIAVVAFGAATFAGDDELPTAATPQPLKGTGVILIVVDTLRADVLGAYGFERDGVSPTPNLDAFARSGRLFTDVSAQASWTKPAVASILTSRHVSGHDAMAKPAVLPESLPTIATTLKAAGVATGAVVTNYNLEEGFGFARGFDRFQYLAPARYLGAPQRANHLAAYNVYRLLREKLFTSAREARHFYRTGDVVNAAGFAMLDEMAKNPGDRFFLWLHYMEPHDPYFAADGSSYARVSHPHPPAEWADRMRGAYLDGVTRFDGFFGELLEGIKARGLDHEHGVDIVLVADHGEEFGEHGGFYHGVTLYEEQLHVPLIIGGAQVGSGVEASVARQIDVAPTIAALYGVPAPPTWEGRDLFGDAPVPEVTIAEEDHEGNVLTSVRWTDPSRPPLKLLRANEGNPRGLSTSELYDLAKDPGEKTPIDAPATVEGLTTAFEAARERAKTGAASASNRALDSTAEAELRSLGYVQ